MTTSATYSECVRPLRILLVEDNSDGRETLRTLLELLGHQVETAADGLEGLEKARSWQPEVVLLDIGLPRLDGYQVARHLRRLFGSDLFLIAHTGYGSPEDRRRGAAAGFDVHLVKPMKLEELCSWLAAAADQAASPEHRGLHPHTRSCVAAPC